MSNHVNEKIAWEFARYIKLVAFAEYIRDQEKAFDDYMEFLSIFER